MVGWVTVVLSSCLCSNTQTPMMALEALIHFRQAVPFEGAEINVRVEINVPNRTLNAQWTTDHKNFYQQWLAKRVFWGMNMHSTKRWYGMGWGKSNVPASLPPKEDKPCAI